MTLQPAANGFQGEEWSDRSPRLPERLEAITTTLRASGAASRRTYSAHDTLAKYDRGCPTSPLPEFWRTSPAPTAATTPSRKTCETAAIHAGDPRSVLSEAVDKTMFAGDDDGQHRPLHPRRYTFAGDAGDTLRRPHPCGGRFRIWSSATRVPTFFRTSGPILP